MKLIFHSIVCSVMLCASSLSAHAALPLIPEDAQGAQVWKSKRVAEVEELMKMPQNEMFGGLGTMIRQLSRHIYRDSIEKEDLISLLRTHLISTAGHAEYYGIEIRRIMDDKIAKRESGDDHQRMWAFETLELLPSPETAKVLGELLYDDRDPWAGRDFHDTGPPIPNFKRASMALTQLGIRKPPVKNQYPGRSGFELEEVETWKIWYEQVRDGTRTFSFEGDDAIYNLSGRTTVEKDGPMRSRPDRKPASPDTEEPEKGLSSIGRTPVIIAVLLLIGIVVFTIQQMRKRTA